MTIIKTLIITVLGIIAIVLGFVLYIEPIKGSIQHTDSNYETKFNSIYYGTGFDYKEIPNKF